MQCGNISYNNIFRRVGCDFSLEKPYKGLNEAYQSDQTGQQLCYPSGLPVD